MLQLARDIVKNIVTMEVGPKLKVLRVPTYFFDASIFYRKVNGIEKVIMPKLQNTETYIVMEMDERVTNLL